MYCNQEYVVKELLWIQYGHLSRYTYSNACAKSFRYSSVYSYLVE